MNESHPPDGCSGSATACWRGRVFGIGLQADFRAAGMLEQRGVQARSDDAAPSARRSHLRLVPRETLEAAWPAEGTTRLREARNREGRSVLTIDGHPEAGYRLDASYYGRFVVAQDGRHVLCAPTAIADWEWHAFVIGQVLPLLAVLQGLEPVHGSAVAYGDAAIGLVAPSRGGKSSLAINLVRQGAAFVADDVLALEREGDGIVLYPGPSLASVRHAEAAAIGPAGLARLGTVIGRSDEELRVAVPLQPRPLRLAALYFVDRAEREPAAAIEPVEPDLPTLLDASYSGFVLTPARLIGQLDLYAHMTRCVPAFRAVVWPGIDAYGLARLIREHAFDAIASAA